MNKLTLQHTRVAGHAWMPAFADTTNAGLSAGRCPMQGTSKILLANSSSVPGTART